MGQAQKPTQNRGQGAKIRGNDTLLNSVRLRWKEASRVGQKGGRNRHEGLKKRKAHTSTSGKKKRLEKVGRKPIRKNTFAGCKGGRGRKKKPGREKQA